MPTTTPFGFQEPQLTEEFLVQAEATNIGGFTVNQNFAPEVEDILRDETVLWQMLINKKPAPAATVKKIWKNARPVVGFTNRSNLAGALANSHAATANDLSDPGQEVKALAGTIEFEHFARSMADQQGRPFGDEVAEETAELIVNCGRFLEMSLFAGDASAPGGLEFNGIDRLIPATGGHIHTSSIVSPEPDSIVSKINEVCLRASTDRNRLRKISHIFCTGSSALKIRDEVGQAVLYQNLREIVAGYEVPGIVTANGIIPIITTPYLNDIDGGVGEDICRYYLLDLSTLEWNGVYPFGGLKSLEPQIFDISNTINGLPLVQKRMVLIYGCLYAKNRGEGLYRLDVTVPSGSVWNTAQEVLI